MLLLAERVDDVRWGIGMTFLGGNADDDYVRGVMDGLEEAARLIREEAWG